MFAQILEEYISETIRLKSERFDGMEHFYLPIQRFQKWTSILFWTSAVLSFAVLFPQQSQLVRLQNTCQLLFSMSVVIHLLLSLSTKYYLIPKADGKRRKQLLSNSFDVPLTPEQTRIYYNNPIAPSIQRLGVNILENSFFAKSVCGEMAVRGRIRNSIYLILWFLVLLSPSSSLGILAVVTQILFSGELFSRQVSIEVLRHRNETIYSELYQQFLLKIDFDGNTGTACILDAFATYEAAKAAAALKQSTSIFHKLNPRLSKEWDDICYQLGIALEKPEETVATHSESE